MTQRDINQARLFIDDAGRKAYFTRSLDALERVREVCALPWASHEANELRKRILAAMEGTN